MNTWRVLQGVYREKLLCRLAPVRARRPMEVGTFLASGHGSAEPRLDNLVEQLVECVGAHIGDCVMPLSGQMDDLSV